MKKLCSKTLKILIMNWTDQCISKKLLLPEKSRLYYSILSLTKLNYFMPYKIKLQLEVAEILSGEREIVSKKILEVLIKRWIFDGSDETEIVLPFYRSISAFWNIFSGFATQTFHSCHGHGLEVTWNHLWREIKTHLFT